MNNVLSVFLLGAMVGMIVASVFNGYLEKERSKLFRAFFDEIKCVANIASDMKSTDETTLPEGHEMFVPYAQERGDHDGQA